LCAPWLALPPNQAIDCILYIILSLGVTPFGQYTIEFLELFFETEAKDLPHLFIKQKRIAQLINGKPG
jgi:hypothetical protein